MDTATIMQQRRSTASAWATRNPVLADGQLGLEKDTGRMKVGDGETHWNELGYAVGGGDTGSIATLSIADQNDDPIADAVVALNEVGSETLLPTKTDFAGRALIGLRSATTYEIQVRDKFPFPDDPLQEERLYLPGDAANMEDRVRQLLTKAAGMPTAEVRKFLKLTNYANARRLADYLKMSDGNGGIAYSAQGLSTFGSLNAASGWDSGILIPNGHVICIPRNATEVLEIDPIARTVSTWGSVGAGVDKWITGVLAPNGHVIGIPFGATEVLDIDPIARTVSTFGSLSGARKWYGGVLAPNGHIIGIPNSATEVLDIDPIARTVTTFGSLSGADNYFGGVLAPNGLIFGIPRNATVILEIDPIARTVSTFGSLSSDPIKWYGGVLAPNGLIFGIPRNATVILEIDPIARTATTWGNLSSDLNKWDGGVLAPNGHIIGIPNSATEVLDIDPIARTVTTFGNLGNQANKWHSGVLVPGGKVICAPYAVASILEIAPDDTAGLDLELPLDLLLSAYGNKY